MNGHLASGHFGKAFHHHQYRWESIWLKDGIVVGWDASQRTIIDASNICTKPRPMRSNASFDYFRITVRIDLPKCPSTSGLQHKTQQTRPITVADLQNLIGEVVPTQAELESIAGNFDASDAEDAPHPGPIVIPLIVAILRDAQAHLITGRKFALARDNPFALFGEKNTMVPLVSLKTSCRTLHQQPASQALEESDYRLVLQLIELNVITERIHLNNDEFMFAEDSDDEDHPTSADRSSAHTSDARDGSREHSGDAGEGETYRAHRRRGRGKKRARITDDDDNADDVSIKSLSSDTGEL